MFSKTTHHVVLLPGIKETDKDADNETKSLLNLYLFSVLFWWVFRLAIHTEEGNVTPPKGRTLSWGRGTVHINILWNFLWCLLLPKTILTISVVTLMLTVTLTEKTEIYQSYIQGLRGVRVHNFLWNFVFLFTTDNHERALDRKKPFGRLWILNLLKICVGNCQWCLPR